MGYDELYDFKVFNKKNHSLIDIKVVADIINNTNILNPNNTELQN